ncbi:MAG TPA: AMP-binding protein [bacterium]|nr:AMP-binding protein [bacterium]HOL48443.1 AMP-binding protein [bacterium]HPQ19743.1 AMP-binding protein [bacterium]
MYYNIFSILKEKKFNSKYTNKICLIDRQNKFTYSEIYKLTVKLANYIKTQTNIKQGSRVGILLKKSWEEVVSIFAINAAEMIIVPINSQLKNEQIQHIINDCNIEILITSGILLRNKNIDFNIIERIKEIITVDEITKDSKYIKNILLSDILNSNALDYEIKPKIIGKDISALLYTSGSTGRPKGVILSNDTITQGAEIVASYLELSDDIHTLSVLPFSFDYGLNQLMNTFHIGGTVHLINYLLINDLINYIQNNQISVLALVPHLWIELINILEKNNKKLESLKIITNSGGTLYPKYSLKFSELIPNARVYLMYGLTEAFRSTYLPPSQLKIRPTSIGKAIPNVEILVIDENGNECEPGQKGELVHRGALITLGYWNDIENTKKVFKKNPLQKKEQLIDEIVVYSGDIVSKDEEGYLYFHSRKDNIIKSMGYRLNLQEIEVKVLELNFVKEAVAIGIPDMNVGTKIKLIIPNINANQIEEVKKFLLKELPYYMQPAEIISVDNLPLNNNGKIDRPKITEMFK